MSCTLLLINARCNKDVFIQNLVTNYSMYPDNDKNIHNTRDDRRGVLMSDDSNA